MLQPLLSPGNGRLLTASLAPLPQAAPLCPEIAKEIAQFEAFKASDFYTSRGLRPYRTELCVGWRHDGRSVSAGQIDALYVDKDGLYYLFDFKRVAKNHKLDPEEVGFRAGRDADPACGLGPMAHLPDTHFQKYSLQTSIYNLMLLNLHGKDVEDRMYLLRMHADRAAFELVLCRDLRSEAREALRVEEERLVEAAPRAAPAAPQAAPAVPGGASDGSPGAEDAPVAKRPRGRAPEGKVWTEGKWMARPRARKAPTPVTTTTLKVRPRGPAPKGDAVGRGCWLLGGRQGWVLQAPGRRGGSW